MPWAATFFANMHVKLYLSQMGKKSMSMYSWPYNAHQEWNKKALS